MQELAFPVLYARRSKVVTHEGGLNLYQSEYGLRKRCTTGSKAYGNGMGSDLLWRRMSIASTAANGEYLARTNVK
eukprot:2759933-Rhodomonas_salina.1